MKIFLSHKSRDKPLVNDFREQLPAFLRTWVDNQDITWGDSLTDELRSAIQSDVDFLIVFLDKDSLTTWVQQELEWAIQRERELNRTFVLPILLPEAAHEQLPSEITGRLYLKLNDYNDKSIDELAERATEHLFKLIHFRKPPARLVSTH